MEPVQQLTEAELWALLSSGPGAATGSQALAEAQPASAAEAITAGLVAFKAGRYTEALERFRSSQDLPGSGVMRVRGKPRELSNGELHAALYNSAAALMRMGQFDDALAELSSLVRAGFTDAQLVMQDSDFAELRRLRPNELAALLKPIARAPGPLDWLLNGS
jgi:predicted Zn-dependent protease